MDLQFIMNGTAGQASKFGFTLLIKTLESLVSILFGWGQTFAFTFSNETHSKRIYLTRLVPESGGIFKY